MRESTVFGRLWILDLELLLLISRIARKRNRATTFFVRSHSLPKSPFLLRQEISRERGLWLLSGDYKKMFLLVQTYLGGNLIVPPHLTPQIQCLPGPTFPPIPPKILVLHTPNTLVGPPPKILFFFAISGAQKRGILFFRRPTTLSAISRAVDGVERRLFNPSHPTSQCASIGYSYRRCDALPLS